MSNHKSKSSHSHGEFSFSCVVLVELLIQKEKLTFQPSSRDDPDISLINVTYINGNCTAACYRSFLSLFNILFYPIFGCFPWTFMLVYWIFLVLDFFLTFCNYFAAKFFLPLSLHHLIFCLAVLLL